jgi:hypothetical protein
MLFIPNYQLILPGETSIFRSVNFIYVPDKTIPPAGKRQYADDGL